MKSRSSAVASYVFHLYDHNYSRQGRILGMQRKMRADVLPPVQVDFSGPKISITIDGCKFTGRISAFLLFLSQAWSWCRGYTVAGEPTVVFSNFYVHDYLQYESLADCVLLACDEEFITLIIWLFKNGEIEEAGLALDGLLRAFSDEEDKEGGDSFGADIKKLIPDKILEKVKTPTEKFAGKIKFKSTYLASAKLIVQILSSESDPAKRSYVARQLCDMVCGTEKLLSFQQSVFRPLMKLIPKESNDAVRIWLFIAFELGCGLHHYYVLIFDEDSLKAYKAIQELSAFLISQRVNSQINHVRLWESSHFPENTDKIKASEKALEEVIRLDCRALAETGKYNAENYPNYSFLLTVYGLRVGILSTRDVAEKRLAEALSAIEAARGKYNAHGLGISLAMVQELIITLCRTHGLPLPFEDRTVKYSPAGFIDITSTLLDSDYIVTRCEIVGQGKYIQTSPLKYLDMEIAVPGGEIKIGPGEFFGIDYFLDGQPWNRRISTQITISFPLDLTTKEVRTDLIEVPSYLGMKNSFFWGFEQQDDIPKGQWSIEISFPDDKEGLRTLRADFHIKA